MSEKKHLLETLVKSESVYSAGFIHLVRDTVLLPDNNQAIREYVRHNGGVGIIAITDKNEIVLEYQYRHPVQNVIQEIPAGKIDRDEDHLVAAKRELLEETGYTAKKWVYLGRSMPSVGYSSEELVYYLAEGLSLGATQLDEGEFIETHTMPVDEFMQLAYSGKIYDGKTLAGLMLYQGYLLGHHTSD